MSEAQATFWGLTVEEASGPPVEIWPDNMQAVDVFNAMSTQWRTGYAGAIGLDYSVLPTIFKIRRIAQSKWAAIFDDVRVMEVAALEVMHKK